MNRTAETPTAEPILACTNCGAACTAVAVSAPSDPAADFLRCPECGVLRRRMLPSAAEIASLYQEAYYARDTARRFPEPCESLSRFIRAQRARSVRRWLPRPPANVLDVGCGRGVFLAALQRMGYRVFGTQLSLTAAESIQRHYGYKVFVGDLPDAPWPPGFFDVVTLWHVLEHLPDPGAALSRIALLLQPGGVFVVEVPNAGGFSARRFGWRWLHWDRAHHLSHFTEPALRRLLASKGFIVEHRSTFSLEFGPTAILQSLLNFLPGRENLLFQSVQTGCADKPAWHLVLLHLVIAVLAMPVAGILFLFSLAVRQGDVLRLVCRRAPHPVNPAILS